MTLESFLQQRCEIKGPAFKELGGYFPQRNGLVLFFRPRVTNQCSQVLVHSST